MKKNMNAFKEARVTTATRVIIAVCVLLVLGALALFISLPQTKVALRGWFKTEKPAPVAETPSGNDTGLAGTVAVNENLRVRPLGSGDHMWGPIAAPVQLIVYDDFECPFCAQLYDTIQQAKAEFGNDLVVVVRHFPLSSHANAVPAAIAAECAAKQGKFWEMYHELFGDNKSGRLSPEEIITNGGTIGLDEAAYNTCLTKEEDKAKILAEKDEIKSLGVIGTPASFLNSQYLPGAMPYEDFTHPDGTSASGLQSLIRAQLNKQ